MKIAKQIAVSHNPGKLIVGQVNSPSDLRPNLPTHRLKKNLDNWVPFEKRSPANFSLLLMVLAAHRDDVEPLVALGNFPGLNMAGVTW
jgi:hypothetical protein